MVEEKRGGQTGPALVIGGIGGTILGAIAALLLAKPAAAAPPEEKLDYLIDCLTTLVPVLAEVAESNAQLLALLQQWLTAQGIPPGEGIQLRTAWVAKEPEQIYNHAIRAIGTFYSDSMVDWTRGKRLVIKVESSLNQAIQVQLIGNHVDDMDLATNINGPLPCPANSNISVGLAWDDWHPFIGVRITTAVAPTAGILHIWSVIQE